MKLVLGRQNPTFSVVAVQLRADITYSKATVSVIIDERGLNKYARDYVNEVDQITIAASKLLETSQSVVDELTGYTLDKAVLDTVSTTEVVTRSIGFSRSYSDDCTISDSVDTLGVGKKLSHQIAALDTLTRALEKLLADTVVVVDNADTNSGDGLEYADVKPSSDLVGASDLAVAELVKILEDAVALTELLHQVVKKALADDVGTADQVAFAVEQPLSDDYTASDLFDRVFDANLAKSDSILTLDALASIGVEKLLTDAISAVSAGSLRMTDYVDITYLAEDYVGTSTTFS